MVRFKAVLPKCLLLGTPLFTGKFSRPLLPPPHAQPYEQLNIEKSTSRDSILQ